MTGLQNGHNPARGEYDYRSFAQALKRKYYDNPTLAMRPLAVTIGVTVSDLSRAMGGQMVSVGKVIALCRWLDVPVDHFYIEPEIDGKSTCFTGSNVKHGGREVRS